MHPFSSLMRQMLPNILDFKQKTIFAAILYVICSAWMCMRAGHPFNVYNWPFQTHFFLAKMKMKGNTWERNMEKESFFASINNNKNFTFLFSFILSQRKNTWEKWETKYCQIVHRNSHKHGLRIKVTVFFLLFLVEIKYSFCVSASLYLSKNVRSLWLDLRRFNPVHVRLYYSDLWLWLTKTNIAHGVKDQSVHKQYTKSKFQKMKSRCSINNDVVSTLNLNIFQP